MSFDLNTHIIAVGDQIIYNTDDVITVTETDGFAANSGGKSECVHDIVTDVIWLSMLLLEVRFLYMCEKEYVNKYLGWTLCSIKVLDYLLLP